MDILQTVAFAIYVMGVVFALYMTRQERRWNPCPNLFFSLLGYAACFAWPALLVVFAVLAPRDGQDARFPAR